MSISIFHSAQLKAHIRLKKSKLKVKPKQKEQKKLWRIVSFHFLSCFSSRLIDREKNCNKESDFNYVSLHLICAFSMRQILCFFFVDNEMKLNEYTKIKLNVKTHKFAALFSLVLARFFLFDFSFCHSTKCRTFN